MKYICGFPWRNRADLLRQAIHSIQPYWPHTIVIDNSADLALRREPPFPSGVQIYEPPVPLTFTQSMNYFIRVAEERGCDVVLYMQNDCEAHPGTAERFIEVLESLKQKGVKWGVAFTAADTLAALNMEAVKVVGLWDTVFPVYFSDCDYYLRMRVAGFNWIGTDLPVTHHVGSSTIKADPYLGFLNNVTFPLYQRYFESKWGGAPGQEVFTRPFNQ